jgi:hypothetical protein
MPGWSEGIGGASEVSQAAVRVTVMACGPARSESSHRRTFPLAMSAPPMLQPEGSAANGADLDEGHVDQQQFPVADHQVARTKRTRVRWSSILEASIAPAATGTSFCCGEDR